MLKAIIKRDGSVEDFKPSKLNHWAEWAAKDLGDRIDWSSIVLHATKELSGTISSQDLQRKLVDKCNETKSWPYVLMAGKLYATIYRKELYGDIVPTVQHLVTKLVSLGIMAPLDYSDVDYAFIESIIDHNRDFALAHFQLEQIRYKYALTNKVTKEEYETPQFVYMRMAMALAESEPSTNRLIDLKAWYDHFSLNRLNPPTPNFTNLGTHSNGYASCCLYKANDSARSLAAGDHIAYTMTYMSAGIGGHLNTRSIGDPIRGGSIVHKGKYKYYKSVAGQVGANMQGSRGGACTQYFTCYDPEAMSIIMYQNPKTVTKKQNRDIHFNIMFNRHIGVKAALFEDIFTFTSYSAPDLYEAFFSADEELFNTLYLKYEQDENFPKQYVSARRLLAMAGQQSEEVATMYYFRADEANRHTSFKETIYSSNLCVAPETLILTDKGNLPISTLKDQEVNVWNGGEFSTVVVRQTSLMAKLLKVKTLEGKVLECTPEHIFYVVNPDGIAVQVPAKELRSNDRLSSWLDTDGWMVVGDTIFSVEDEGRVDATYCFTEPLNHTGIFNGIMTGQCNEITVPTEGYESITDLYKEGYIGDIKFTTQEGNITYTLKNNWTVMLSGKCHKQANDLESGDIILAYCPDSPTTGFVELASIPLTVKEIIYKDKQPEVGLCSLAGAVISNIHDDATYESVCYYGLKMIDKCIHKAHYELPHVGWTAKNRLNAGFGVVGLAHYLAQRGLDYTSDEGLKENHRAAERHAYYVIKASLKLGKELGNAPWIHKTKWPDGWLPIDTYKRTVDELVAPEYQYDWDTLRKDIIANKGIRNSSLIAHMPTESSSKASGVPNGLYPIRDVALKKLDGSNRIDWVAPDADILNYQIAWDLGFEAMAKVYAIWQKFTDQSISADYYRNRVKNPVLTTEELLNEFLIMIKYGNKSKYYQNPYTVEVEGLEDQTVNSKIECAGGGCTL